MASLMQGRSCGVRRAAPGCAGRPVSSRRSAVDRSVMRQLIQPPSSAARTAAVLPGPPATPMARGTRLSCSSSMPMTRSSSGESTGRPSARRKRRPMSPTAPALRSVPSSCGREDVAAARQQPGGLLAADADESDVERVEQRHGATHEGVLEEHVAGLHRRRRSRAPAGRCLGRAGDGPCVARGAWRGPRRPGRHRHPGSGRPACRARAATGCMASTMASSVALHEETPMTSPLRTVGLEMVGGRGPQLRATATASSSREMSTTSASWSP